MMAPGLPLTKLAPQQKLKESLIGFVTTALTIGEINKKNTKLSFKQLIVEVIKI